MPPEIRLVIYKKLFEDPAMDIIFRNDSGVDVANYKISSSMHITILGTSRLIRAESYSLYFQNVHAILKFGGRLLPRPVIDAFVYEIGAENANQLREISFICRHTIIPPWSRHVCLRLDAWTQGFSRLKCLHLGCDDPTAKLKIHSQMLGPFQYQFLRLLLRRMDVFIEVEQIFEDHPSGVPYRTGLASWQLSVNDNGRRSLNRRS